MLSINQAKALLNTISSPIVFCDLDHIILYMNQAAIKRYEKFGGEKILGKSLLDCHNPNSINDIKDYLVKFKEGKSDEIFVSITKDNFKSYMMAVRDESGKLIGYFEEFRPNL